MLRHEITSVSDTMVHLGITQPEKQSSEYLPCRDKSQLCIGMPSNCIEFENCALLFKSTIDRNTSKLHFELIGFDIKVNDSKYVWIALSDDQKMDDDLVFVCSKMSLMDGSQPTSFLILKSRGKIPVLPPLWASINAQRAAEPISKSFNNDKLICKWQYPYKVEINKRQYNFLEDFFFILMAKGNIAVSFCKLRILDCGHSILFASFSSNSNSTRSS